MQSTERHVSVPPFRCSAPPFRRHNGIANFNFSANEFTWYVTTLRITLVQFFNPIFVSTVMCRCSMISFALKIATLAVILGLVRFYVNSKNTFLLSGRGIKVLAEKYCVTSTSNKPSFDDEQRKRLIEELASLYDGHVNRDPQEWIWNIGGALVKIRILYLSMTEYLALIHAPVPSTGHSGLHWMNQSCLILSGKIVQFKTGDAEYGRKEIFAGRYLRLFMFEPSIISTSSRNETWMLCRGSGFVPASFPSAFINNVLTTGDLKTVVSIVWLEGKLMIVESLRALPFWPASK
uniref:Sigma non-opioid intracellular receptor 1 n=1 Tax=Romanomermis culicivorax TaxID=13658 RepID=A0A915J6B5_ROMCU